MAETPRVSVWAFGLMLAGATTGMFLAGGPPQGSLGIFLLCAGAALTFCPPQAKVEWSLWLAAVALVACGALVFLPEGWFAVPAWRRTLEAAPAIHLPATITALPWETGFWLAMLALSLLVGLFLLAHPLRSRWLLAFALMSATAAGVYGGLAIYAKETGWHYPFASEATFGFFPNRNHTATLLFVGGLLALGVLSVALRQGRWLAGLLAAGIVTVCVVALVFSRLHAAESFSCSSAPRGGFLAWGAATVTGGWSCLFLVCCSPPASSSCCPAARCANACLPKQSRFPRRLILSPCRGRRIKFRDGRR